MKLIIVDDNRSFLEGATFFAEKKLDYEVIASFESPLKFIKSKLLHIADVVLMDIEMPELNGIIAVKQILRDFKHIRFIAVTNHTEKAYLQDLICAGFKGCVFKNNLFEELEHAVKEVYQGGYFFPDNIKL